MGAVEDAMKCALLIKDTQESVNALHRIRMKCRTPSVIIEIDRIISDLETAVPHFLFLRFSLSGLFRGPIPFGYCI